MKTWQEGINLDLPKGAQCSGNFTGLGPLLDHCVSKKDVYHSGFKEYMWIMTGGYISLPRQQQQAATQTVQQNEPTQTKDSPLHTPLVRVTQVRNTTEHQAAPTLHAGTGCARDPIVKQ